VSDRALWARSALDHLIQPGSHGNLAGAPGVTLGERTDLGIVSVMARRGMAEALSTAVKAAFGADLPLMPRRVEASGIAFVWTGPERWLAMASGQTSQDLVQRLMPVCAGLAAVAEQGDGRVIIRMAGPRARDMLAKILTLDLHPRVFRPGDTAVTGAAHLEVQIWQLDDAPTYEVALFRGFAGSFWHWLTQSAAEYGYQIVAPGRS
jgi:methylglutamate dehydrogenase subunit D